MRDLRDSNPMFMVIYYGKYQLALWLFSSHSFCTISNVIYQQNRNRNEYEQREQWTFMLNWWSMRWKKNHFPIDMPSSNGLFHDFES